MRIPPQIYRDFVGGMLSDANVSITPANTCSLLQNLDADIELGSLVTRLGTALIGSQLQSGKVILGIHQHIDTTNSANNKLFATVNASNDATSVIKDVVAGTNSVTSLTASKKMRFLTFLGTTLAINGADAERSYTSAGWLTSGGNLDVANTPSSNTVNLCITFLDRVYVAGDTAQPTRLYYSGLSNGSTISWTVGNGYLEVDANSNSGPITALGKVPGYVLIFKERSMHRWNFSSAFPESLVQIGTPSQESVIMGGGLCAFYSNSNENAKGFYVTNGGRPTPISHDGTRPIKKWIDAIATSSEANIAGWATDRHFCWSIGDVTVDGETYNNVVLKYNRILNQWTVRTYPNEFRVFANYLVSSVNTTVGGDDNGYVVQMDKPATYTDYPSATAIPWKMRTQHSTWGYNQIKSMVDIAIIRGRQLQAPTMTAILNEDLDQRVPLTAPSLIQRVVQLFKLGKTIEGNTICIEVADQASGARTYIRELELPNIDIFENYV